MSKNKNRGNKDNKDRDASSAEAPASTPKTRKPMPPRGPLPERLCNKADKIYSMATEMAKELSSRGAPKEKCDAATAFVVQVEAWREGLFALKSSGWVPSDKAVKSVIVEGDPIKIVDEHLARYSFIEGLAEGKVQLVAGSVVEVNRFQVDVMLKDTEGKFYGYAPRKFLTRR
jgi:hypothetical protein